jgi:hypothetical protein
VTGQEIDAADLQARINDSGAPWRRLGSEFDNPCAVSLIQIHGIYRWVRLQFPDLTLGAEAMNVIADEFVGGTWLCAREMPVAGSSVRCDGLQAAAELGRAGELEAVLVSCAILSHGFDSHGGVGIAQLGLSLMTIATCCRQLPPTSVPTEASC